MWNTRVWLNMSNFSASQWYKTLYTAISLTWSAAKNSHRIGSDQQHGRGFDSLSKNNNMAALKSCENILFFPLLLVLKLDSPTSDFNWVPKNCTAAPAPQKKSPLLRFCLRGEGGCSQATADHCVTMKHELIWTLYHLEDFRNCGRQEEPAILIFRFLQWNLDITNLYITKSSV